MVKFNLKELSDEQKTTRRRILEISHKLNLSHLGSCLSSVDLIDAVYEVKSKDEKFVLSNGHAGVAWYAVLEKYGILKTSETEKLHVHPDRNPSLGIDVSTGSLGQGLPIALGIALSNRKKNVYCTISDGETTEGSIWESFRIIQDRKIRNLKILINANGWGAYTPISADMLYTRIKGFVPNIKKVNGHDTSEIIKALKSKTENVVFAETQVNQFPFLKGQGAHYYIMSDEDFTLAMDLLK